MSKRFKLIALSSILLVVFAYSSNFKLTHPIFSFIQSCCSVYSYLDKSTEDRNKDDNDRKRS